MTDRRVVHLWLWLVRHIGGLYDLGPISIGMFDDSAVVCRRRQVVPGFYVRLIVWEWRR